jgi:8-oxo-dGTP pyrophosphatase MutT (NUDIX family)
MSDKSGRHPATPVPAATILLLRDGDKGLEVFMVKRHHEIDFAGGALVFPGGKADRNDCEEEITRLVDGLENFAPDWRTPAITALREAFEEAGILIARDATGAFVDETRCEALQPFRERIETGAISLAALLRQERLRLACDTLVPFAHWITPKSMPKRFDTHFFIARVPAGQDGQHCGRESVDSLWVNPHETTGAQWHLMFPTRMNLLKLAGSRDVDEALATARTAPPVTVEPWTEETPDGTYVRIPEDAGYLLTRLPLKEALP